MARFRILGPLEAEGTDGPIPLAGQRQRALLALLLVNANRPVSPERAVEDIWGDEATSTTVKSLRSLVSRVRNRLGSGGQDLIRTVPAGYVMEIARHDLDALQFEDMIEAARTLERKRDLGAAVATLQRALDLWRGDPLPDLQDLDFARLEAARLHELYAAARITLAEAQLALGRHREMTGEIATLVEEEPYREEVWRLWMLALYRSERQAEALRAFDRCRDTLAEIGLEPATETRELASAIASHDPDLAWRGQAESAAPAGTVTFLFTDVEGSTKLWESDAAAMQSALDTHEELVGSALRRHGGHLFAARGDSYSAAFTDAGGALAAALDLLRGATSDRSPTIPFAVRVAVHTGETRGSGANYQGPAVDRTSRLLGAAHGGQIVVSLATREMVGDALPPRTRMIDLGEHRLRDLTRPERVFQLHHPDLRERFPPLATVGARSNNLPVQLTSFVGRENEVTAAVRALRETRLLTLTGVGGAGKSRLAIQVGARALDQYPGGVWLSELAPIERTDLVVSQIAAPFGVRDLETESGRSLLDVLVDHIGDRELLLLLDNCEHLIQEVAEVAEALLVRCPGLDILTTSRQPLGIDGEILYSVPPMTLPTADDVAADQTEAVMLFAERAAQARPEFRVERGNRHAVCELVRRLDGLPLAIELAASRVNVLGPVQILERLEDRFTLLGGRTAGRHATLVAALDWSHDLLDADEQALFRRLAVFAGGWTLRDAEAVSAYDELEEHRILDLLGGLVDKSLVEVTEREGSTRYRFLETMREYAAARLREAEPDAAVRLRHAARFLELAEESESGLRGPEQANWVRRLEAEHENLRSAIDWAIVDENHELALRLVASLGWFWWIRGYWKEAMQRFHQIYESGLEAAPLLRAEAIYKVTRIEVMRVRPREVAPLIEEALEILRSSDDLEGMAWATMLHGETAPLLATPVDWDRSAAVLKESLGLFSRVGDEWGKAFATYSLGLALTSGDNEAGLKLVRDAIGEMERLGDRWCAAWFSFNLGSVLALSGDLERGRRTVERSRELARGTGDHWVEPHALSRLAAIATLGGDHDEARGLFQQVLPQLRQIGDENCTAMSHLYLGESLIAGGSVDEARDSLVASLRTYEDMNHPLGTARVLLRLAVLAEAAGDSQISARLLGAAVAHRAEKGPDWMIDHEKSMLADLEAALAARLPAKELEALRAEGSGMSTTEAVALSAG